MTTRIATLLIATAVLAGCSSSSDNDNANADTDANAIPDTNNTTANQTSMLAPGADPSNAPVTVTRFDGNYLRPCEPAGVGEWEIIELSIQGDVFDSILTEYSDAQCTQPTFVLESTGSAVFPGGTVNTPFGVADFVNITFESAIADGAVDNDFESFTDFDLILLDGNNLFFGLFTDELDGESEDTRPNEVDEEFIFTRL